MPFPHPQSRKDKYRNEDKPSSGGVVWNLVKRTVNVTDYRNAQDDVNPANNRTFGGITHVQVLLCYWFFIPNCLAYSAFSRCQPPNCIASPPAMRPMGVPLRRRSRTSKQMCQPAAPHEMKRRSILCHSVRRVPPPKASSSHRISPYSSTSGASARVTVVTCGLPVPTQVRFADPTVPRLASVTKGAHSRRCAGSVSACQTFSGAWRNSLTRTSVHFSPSFTICAPVAGPGVYCSRLVIFFSCSPGAATSASAE